MAIEIITNNAFHFCTQVRQWDLSATTNFETDYQNFTKGARYQKTTLLGDNPTALRYLNDSFQSYPWSVTGARVVITKVASLGTATVSCGVGNLSTGISAESTGTSTGSGLIGRDNADFVHEADSIELGSDDYSFIRFVGFAGAKTLFQCYLGSPFSFSSLNRVPIRRSTFFDWIRGYKCDEQIEIEFVGVSKSEYITFSQLPKLVQDPFFIYDSSGDYLAEKLVHVVAESLPSIQEFDGRYSVGLRCFRLHDREL